MIEEQAIVVGLQGKYAAIQMQRHSACNHCELNQGCGAGAIGRLLGYRNKPLRIRNTAGLKSGDRILLGMPDRHFLQASLLIYGLPLGLLVITAVLMKMLFGGSEILILMGAIAGFTGGLLMSSKLAKNQFSAQLNPTILQVNDEPTNRF